MNILNFSKASRITSRSILWSSTHPSRAFSTSPVFSMSSNEKSSLLDNDTSTPKSSEQQPTLALPSTADSTKLDMSSGRGTAKLDHLGPMVVNTDGTLARITNWDTMTETEQRNTVRIISKRNKQRLDALKAVERTGEVDVDAST